MDGATAPLRFPAPSEKVVGGRAGAAEARARARVEAPAAQILVVVAHIRARNSKTGEEKGSSTQVIFGRSAGS